MSKCTTMKLLLLLSLLGFTLVQEGASTHLETCSCRAIAELVNTTVQQATARLEYKLSLMINTAISNINMTNDDAKFDALLSDLTSTMERLLKPIRTQLDYHLPPPVHVNLPRRNNSEYNPANSCKTIYDDYPRAESGYYWIGTQGSPVNVYCNMNATSSGEMTGGWMRVAYIDMRNTSHQCPSGLRLSTRTSAPRRLCDVRSTGCVSNSFTVHGVAYSHVYGRIIAYQNGVPIAFNHYSFTTIDEPYVFGVSLTHGQSPRRHIWTFAGASDETTNNPTFKCPCINTNISPPPVPDFIGNDYFCDTGLSSYYVSYPQWQTAFHNLDPLWDGKGCGSTNACCSFKHPPWFVKDFSSHTTNDIEMRLCRPGTDGRTPIEIVELYVQ